MTMDIQNDDHGAVETQSFAEAIAIANIPVLLMVLIQLTGDLRWLGDRYRLSRARGMDDNDSGGLSEAVQAEVRSAALEAIRPGEAADR
jgi:4-hydroxyacetophenone monooxygenase